jgi:uncharacterized iron-regulated protein
LSTSESSEDSEKNERKSRLFELAEKNSKTIFRNRTWENLLDASFFIGENHRDINPKKFLIQNMELLARSGYSVIFMEHLWDGSQEDLTDYLDGEGRKTPVQLRGLESVTQKYLHETNDAIKALVEDNKDYENASQEFNYNAIVREAAKVGIKVIPLEISEENYKSAKRGEDRMIYLNSNTVDVVTREFAENPHLRYIGLVGSAHLLEKHGIPGICKALGVQDVVIADARTPDTQLAHFFGSGFPKVIYDGGVDCSKNSTVGLVMDLSENLDYQGSILEFYNASKALKSDTSETSTVQKSEAPGSSVINNLKKPENPLKKQNRSPSPGSSL